MSDIPWGGADVPLRRSRVVRAVAAITGAAVGIVLRGGDAHVGARLSGSLLDLSAEPLVLSAYKCAGNAFDIEISPTGIGTWVDG